VDAVLAGNIVRLIAKVGDSVAEGDPLLIVEAMKMETAVSAPGAGTLTAIHVKPGDVVRVGDPLVSIG
jgi:oxaloacetate decarboxylase alpha subunit